MFYSPDLLDGLQALDPAQWAGHAYRHMFAGHPPDTENTRGARWNPPGVAAIYLSLKEGGALAEADYQLSLQTPRPRVRRTLYEIELTLDSVLDLSDRILLETLGVSQADLDDPTMAACQTVGGACAWLEHDGILVPSARSDATNLIVYPVNRRAHAVFETLDERDVAA